MFKDFLKYLRLYRKYIDLGGNCLSSRSEIKARRAELLEKKKTAKTKEEIKALEALEAAWNARERKIAKFRAKAGKIGGKARSIKKEKEKDIKDVVEKKDYELDKKTQDEIEAAIRLTGGWLSKTAKELGMPVEKVKAAIKRNKRLKEVLFETKEHLLDLVEDTLFERIIEKKDVLGAMFWLKCQGQHRGWIDKPKNGGSADKPIHIKITPVELPKGERRIGRPKKIYTEVKVLPASQSKDEILESRLANQDEVIEGEIIDS